MALKARDVNYRFCTSIGNKFGDLCGILWVRTSSTTTRDRNLQFRGAVSTGGSPLDFFCFFSRIYVQFGKTSPPKSGESSEKSSGEKIASNPVTSVAVMIFLSAADFARLLQTCSSGRCEQSAAILSGLTPRIASGWRFW